MQVYIITKFLWGFDILDGRKMGGDVETFDLSGHYKYLKKVPVREGDYLIDFEGKRESMVVPKEVVEVLLNGEKRQNGEKKQKGAYPLVLIRWVDSRYRSGWSTEESSDQPVTIESIGWLIGESKDAKTLAPNISNEECPQRCGDMTIPSRAVLEMKFLG